MSLEVSHVTAGYGAIDVLRDVSLTVPAGRVVALLGSNGAGKTTLLHSCSGFVTPRGGRVLLDGHDVTRASAHERTRLGLCHIPEGRAIFPSLTVAENLRLMGDRRGTEAEDRAVEAFPVLGRKRTQIAGTMSGGEQQMLALTRAYLGQPRYVLLDEVSMGLAPLIVDEIFEFLHGLAASNVALLVVEQYVAKALEFADLVYVLNKGRIVFAGEASELDAEALAASYFSTGAGPAVPASRRS
ncbi:MAG TPA: ABC transporter ATP-binding protein [Acidimicrobiia bacterium]|nr:ABC transporter ATP-binding protein [Acidimicrobiia bacterium]